MQNELTNLTNGFDKVDVSNLPAMIKHGIKHEGGLAIKQTFVANLYEQGRAMIADTVLENVGTLSAFEEHLCQVAPNGAGRYKAIVDAYTLGAANKIARW